MSKALVEAARALVEARSRLYAAAQELEDEATADLEAAAFMDAGALDSYAVLVDAMRRDVRRMVKRHRTVG